MKTQKNGMGKPKKFGKQKGKPIFKAKSRTTSGAKTRKDLRKDKRAAKKQRQQQHVLNKCGKGKNKTEENAPSTVAAVPTTVEQHESKFDSIDQIFKIGKEKGKKGSKKKIEENKEGPPQNLLIVKQRLEKEMQKERKKQLQMANKEEDKNIKRLAKQLKMNRRKSKSMPKVFATEGLDYLLDVCDPEKLKILGKNKTALEDSSGSEFEDDFAEVTGRNKIKVSNIESEEDAEMSDNSEDKPESENDLICSDDDEEENSENEDSMEDFSLDSELSEDDQIIEKFEKNKAKKKLCAKNNKLAEQKDTNEDEVLSKSPLKKREKSKKQVRFQDENISDKVQQSKSKEIKKETKKTKKTKNVESKISKVAESESDEEVSAGEVSGDDDDFGSDDDGENDLNDDDGNDLSDENLDGSNNEDKNKNSKYWEDIYGRKRDNKGNVVQETAGRYVPPALRGGGSTDAAKLLRLKRQMQGLLNRVAESNMGGVASQLEEVITAHSRGDCNQVLGQLLHAALVKSHSVTPTKLAAEHALLLALLHAHVGVEIGATFLQTTLTTFDKIYPTNQDIEDKTLNNLLLITCFMYSFKMFHGILMFDILKKLSHEFKEKDIELIMLILKTVGPSLRKDDPAALKELILQLQQQANAATQHKENTRVRFMLDILLAIKNNNMSRIPDYDPELVEHLRKVLRGLLRTGAHVSELKISLEDLLMAEERGRWWVVGSAWQGSGPGAANSEDQNTALTQNFSQKLLELARKQRMNTDVRKNIFCILMTAEDYLDAFEKLLRLCLKGSQEREISYVLLDCCLQEKSYNPYYGHLAQKFCDFDRKHRMSLQCSVWDKIKELSTLSSQHLRNLASLVSQLILGNGLTLSVLKVIQFADLEKISIKFVRQILLGLLLSKDEAASSEVFLRIPSTDQLALFRESLNIFLHRYVLSKKHQLPAGSDTELLIARVSLAEKALTNADSRVTF